ncbi:phospholipase D family protein [Arthrobacter sp.]|uniref:phospholipase D family protein n=1 Tax=Arthrobacter sp. TaxID=1667 RepID=UPI003A926283
MLDPGAREALTEQLRPPAGYRLSHAVGTTFTLDMLSALAVPLSFVRGSGDDPTNAVAVLNAVRKVSDRIDIFCQAGLIRAPRQANDLLAVLEPIIHQVLPPRRDTLFHPKIWLLEFESEVDHCYRFLCGSRNLTSDTTWDLLIRLDGRLENEHDDEAPAPIDNSPLARFVAGLPDLATATLPEPRAQRIAELAQHLATVRWELPQDIHSLAFRPLGTGETFPADSLATFLADPSASTGYNGRSGSGRSFGGQRLLVAPFIDDATVDILSGHGVRALEIYGRGAELDRLSPNTLANDRITFQALDDLGSPLEDETTEPGPAAEDLRGLHAKALFTDFDHTTHVLMGSANATRAAFHGNIEFSLEMTGPKSRIGTDKIRESLGGLPFAEFSGDGGAERTEDDKAEWRLQNELINAAAHAFVLDATPESTSAAYEVRIEHDYIPPSTMTARVGLLTLPSQLTAMGSDGSRQHHLFRGVLLELVTPYVLVELKDNASGLVRTAVVQGVLRTDVEGRIDHIVASQLNTPEKLRAFLLLFLTPEEVTPLGNGGAFHGLFGAAASTGTFAGLFEAVAAAAASPDAAQMFSDLNPIMDRLDTVMGDDPEIDEVRRLWNVAVEAIGAEA